MTKERKEALTKQYMTNDIPSLTEFQKEWIRKETAKHIYVDRDESGKHICHCDRCNEEFEAGKTKHKAKLICPKCKKELEVIHKWRIKNPVYFNSVDWIVIPRFVDANTLMLRYVSIHRHSFTYDIFEAARIVFDTRQKTQHYFCNWESGWKYTKQNYFVEHNMSWDIRKWCCLPAKPYRPMWKRTLNRLDCFKYFRNYMDYANSFYYINDGLKFISYKAPLYEKLSKAGFDELVWEDKKADLKNFGLEYNTKETSLTKMLGLNRNQYKLLKINQSAYKLEYIRMFPNATHEYINDVSCVPVTEIKRMASNNINFNKTVSYIKKAGCPFYEWSHYVDMLKALNYKLDDHYLYPKDFRKEDDRITKEYLEMKRIEYEKKDAERRRELAEKESEQNRLIAGISNALHHNNELKEFFAGSNGLQVVVPETTDDLRNEGMNLHNCIGSYVDSYAKGKTLIFFVRRIEDPTAPYVAVEYRDGKIIQCRFDHNRPVEDEKIINFAEAMAKKLREQNILAA